MAAEWWFYHLNGPPLAAALAPLFEKCLERDWRVLVVSSSEEALALTDRDLWQYRDDSFLPHGRDGELAERHPILISRETENRNDAKVLVLLNGHDAEPSVAFERVMVVFEDGDTEARGKARQQYKLAKDAGQVVRYFKQSDAGGWQEHKG